MSVSVRVGDDGDIEPAVGVYENANIAHRGGGWPGQGSRVAEVSDRLRDREGWFIVAPDGDECVGMAASVPFRTDQGRGPVVRGVCFLSLLFVAPNRWGEGIGGILVDTMLDEARTPDSTRFVCGPRQTMNARTVFTEGTD